MGINRKALCQYPEQNNFNKSATKIYVETTFKVNNLIKIIQLFSIEKCHTSHKTIKYKKVYGKAYHHYNYTISAAWFGCKSLKILFKSPKSSLNLRNFHIPIVSF